MTKTLIYGLNGRSESRNTGAGPLPAAHPAGLADGGAVGPVGPSRPSGVGADAGGAAGSASGMLILMNIEPGSS
jgi:hypothetical protein